MILKKVFSALLCVTVAILACNDGNERNDPELKDPSEVHPPLEAIPDSTKLVNDSVIMPDTIKGNGKQVGKSDSIQKKKQ